MFITKSSSGFDGLGSHALNSFISGSGMAVNYETALQDPTVKACVRVITQTITSLPLKLYKKTNSTVGKQWQEDTNSIMAHVLTCRPNVRQTTPEFIEQMIMQLCIFSEYYAIVDKSPNGKITSITPFNSPKQVSAVESQNGITYQCITNDHRNITLRNDEIFQVRDLSLSTWKALDKVYQSKSSIGLSLAATHNAESYYKQGSRAGGFVVADGKLNDDSFNRLQKQFNDQYSGNDNAHKIGILENGMKYVENKYSLKDAQVLESRNASIREIAAIFGVPLPLLGIMDSSFSDIESINAFFYTSCLQSIISKIEARFKIIVPRDYSLRFDLSEYLKGDVKTQCEIIETMLTRGIISLNEARDRMGLQRIHEKELFVVGSNNLTFGEWKDLAKIQSMKQPINTTNLNGESNVSAN